MSPASGISTRMAKSPLIRYSRSRTRRTSPKKRSFRFLHAFGLLGKSARFDLRLPHKSTRWKGLLDGVPASTGRTGLGDPIVRLSVNFFGAPALGRRELQRFRAARPINTVAGAAVAITLPLGDYEKDKLLNLGQNRFSIRPQLGVVHTRGPWSYELTGSVFFYTDNNEFLGTTREQDPAADGSEPCDLYVTPWLVDLDRRRIRCGRRIPNRWRAQGRPQARIPLWDQRRFERQSAFQPEVCLRGKQNA